MSKSNISSIFQKKIDKLSVSVPRNKELYGVIIRKLPNGAYINALQTVQNLPAILLENCFPGEDIDDILKQLGQINKDSLLAIAGKLMAVIPEEFFKIISELLDIPLEKLINELTPAETIEIIEAFWEANDMSPFFEKLKKIFGNLMKTAPTLASIQTKKS
jgi:hypothetical protein